MREIDHDLLQYEGAAGEQVTITITAHNTVHMVNFVLDGEPPADLPAGMPLRFNLKDSSGSVTRLQLNLGFSGGGSYEIVIENVANCTVTPPPRCAHSRTGFNVVLENHQYFVQ